MATSLLRCKRLRFRSSLTMLSPASSSFAGGPYAPSHASFWPSSEAERGIFRQVFCCGTGAQISRGSFTGVFGEGTKLERFSGYGDGSEGLSTRGAPRGENILVHGERFDSISTKAASSALRFFGDGDNGFSEKTAPGERFLRHRTRSEGFLTQAKLSGSGPEDLSTKATSSGKRSSRPSRQQEAHDIKGEGLLKEIGKKDRFPAGSEQKLQEADGDGTSSWTDKDRHSLAFAIDRLAALRLHALAVEQWNASRLLNINRKYQKSAQNLIHYVALESANLQEMQSLLPTLGLANIEGIEEHVLASLTRVIDAARALLMVHSTRNQQVRNEDPLEHEMLSKYMTQLENSSVLEQHAANRILDVDRLSTISFEGSKLALSHNSAALFGLKASQRKTHIMVTLPEEMAENEGDVLNLMKAGMDIVRINCAHGNTEVWGNMIRTIRHCSQMLEQPCRVLMDLAGPKLRTCAFPPGPCVRKIKPHRDGLGNVTLPARVWVALPGTPVPEGTTADAIVPVEGDIWLSSVQIGDELKLNDARGDLRKLTVTDKFMGPKGVGCWAECYHTTYLESGTKLEVSKKKGKHSVGYVAALPSLDHFIRLKKGDLLVLTKETFQQDANTPWIYRVQVSHTFGQLFDCVKPGELIRFDDGRIEGVISGVTSSEICVEVTLANEKGTKFGGEKSIILPDSNFNQKGLTVKDLVDLDFVVRHADMVGLSFTNSAEDVRTIQQALEKRGAMNMGIVLKIETRSGVQNLPDILLQGMKNENPLGVMIARGDLAVECGWENLAGLQEEIMRVCKAAHVPTIWATQVLEGLAKQGLPTRPEITDAAFGGRATCVMLNKGSHILKAVAVLDNILMQSASPRRDDHTSDEPFAISSLAN